MYYIYIYLYFSIEQDFPQVMAVLSHTHFVLKTKFDTKDNCTALKFSDFFFFKNAQHLPLNYL